MAALHSIRTRPAMAGAAVAVLAVLVASVVPVSYEKVTGQDVSLTFTGLGHAQEVREIAQGFKTLLGSKSVDVETIGADRVPIVVLRAHSTKRAGADLRQAAAQFAQNLKSKGYSASVQVTPHRERVRYPAVAYAWDQIIQISVDGKSASELETEIRNRLAEAGVPNAEVSVTERPEGGREVRLNVERQQIGDPSTAPAPMPQLVLTKNGAPIEGGEGFGVKIQKRKADGSTTLIVEVSANGKTAKVEVPSADSMSDADLTNTISSQLKQAGIDARVTVLNGKVQIEAAK